MNQEFYLHPISCTLISSILTILLATYILGCSLYFHLFQPCFLLSLLRLCFPFPLVAAIPTVLQGLRVPTIFILMFLLSFCARRFVKKIQIVITTPSTTATAALTTITAFFLQAVQAQWLGAPGSAVQVSALRARKVTWATSEQQSDNWKL